MAKVVENKAKDRDAIAEFLGETINGGPVAAKQRGAKGTGTTLTIDLKDHPVLLEAIRGAAQKDDREPSRWLRKRLLKIDEEGQLFVQGEV